MTAAAGDIDAARQKDVGRKGPASRNGVGPGNNGRRWSTTAEEHEMKIQVVKNGNGKVKVMEMCPWLVECPPEPRK